MSIEGVGGLIFAGQKWNMHKITKHGNKYKVISETVVSGRSYASICEFPEDMSSIKFEEIGHCKSYYNGAPREGEVEWMKNTIRIHGGVEDELN